MEEIELYKLLGYIKVSPSIDTNLKMPSEIANDINIKTSQVSAALSDLKKHNLVICINEEVRKGRLYKCTELGLELLKYID